MSKRISRATRLGGGALLVALLAGGTIAVAGAGAPTAPYIAPIPALPPRPAAPPEPPTPPAPPALPPGKTMVWSEGLDAATRTEIQAALRAASVARREAMRDAAEARREAFEEAARARDAAFAEAAAARNAAFAERTRALRDHAIDIRAALVSARQSVAAARGMNEDDRASVLSRIDRALSGLPPRRGPDLQ